MENQNTTQGNPLPPVPGAVAVLVFGIVAICTFWTGLVGLIFAIISMSKSKKVKKIFDESAGMYNPGSMGLVKVGKILGIVSLILSIFFILYWIIVGLFLGALANM
jgi:hypothetical protein